MNAIGEASFFFAIMGTGLYLIMGLCSLPSVGSQMTNKQWQLVYGPIAWAALVFGTIHVLIMGVMGWDEKETWPGGMSPITLTSVLIPLLVMWLKLVQMLVVVLTRKMGASSAHKNDTETSFVYNPEEKLHGSCDEEERSSMLPLKNEARDPTTASSSSQLRDPSFDL